ncbi:MAG: hypothetical protein ACE37K_04460 [Planctomycetota bacterium]
MSHEARQICARTNAVLAVHLDGDLWPTDLDRETFGYAFVSDDSLHAHLRECATCQQALQRSRRLDAALASTAGRELSQHDDLDALGDRWLQNARVAAAARPDDDIALPVGADAAGFDLRSEDVGSRHPSSQNLSSIEPPSPGRRTTWLAAGLLATAAAATWLCLLSPERSVDAGGDRPGNPQDRSGREVVARAALVALAPILGTARTSAVGPDAMGPSRPSAASPMPTAHHHLPLSLAGRMRADRERNELLPEQRSWSLADLSARIARRSLDVPERLAAAERLVRRTRPGSPSARAATDHLLEALAACGDRSEHELLVHEELLDSVRSHSSLMVRLEHRLSTIRGATGRDDRDGELERSEQAAVLVAARVGTSRLDLALRRAVRRRPQVAEVVAASLRCGARIDGAPELLLDCWHDQVALGRHANAPRWASFWFTGQAASTFTQLADVLRATRSTKARERCLLAMGVVGDDSTVKLLLARLVSPRRGEACAAACALAMLPHRVLEPLLPKARGDDQSLLRAALARAGVPAAQSWIRPLGLSRPQQCLLRDASLERFPEVVAWFRNGYAIGD